MTNGHKQPHGTRVADMRRLQEIMHYHGIEEFRILLQQAYYNASEEMEHISTDISDKYRDEANKLSDDIEAVS